MSFLRLEEADEFGWQAEEVRVDINRATARIKDKKSKAFR
jgi:hypothetical protein